MTPSYAMDRSDQFRALAASLLRQSRYFRKLGRAHLADEFTRRAGRLLNHARKIRRSEAR